MIEGECVTGTVLPDKCDILKWKCGSDVDLSNMVIMTSKTIAPIETA